MMALIMAILMMVVMVNAIGFAFRIDMLFCIVLTCQHRRSS